MDMVMKTLKIKKKRKFIKNSRLCTLKKTSNVFKQVSVVLAIIWTQFTAIRICLSANLENLHLIN
jgi:hypothetical protein